jgi:phosphate:Na+ symporter
MISFLQVLGGLTLFLFGVRMLSSGVEKIAGSKIQEWLERMTTGRLKAALFGTGVTAAMQSSSLMMATMIGLINAQIMTLEQAIGMMMGDEIGTTITAQIVAFDIDNLAFLFIALGFVFLEFMPRGKWRDYGEIIMGFGTLFLGMNLMSDALKVLTTIPFVEEWLVIMGQNVLAGLLAGTIVTAIVQSSSAVTGLTVAMGMSQAISLEGAIAILLGANIGTCATGLIASLRLSRAAKQASIAQILINVIGVLIFLPFFSPFTRFVSLTASELPRQIANAHTIFNVAVSAILFPFVGIIARAARRLAPEQKEKEVSITAYIDQMQYGIPSVALTESFKELIRLGEATAKMIERSRMALIDRDMDAARWVLEQENEFVDPVTDVLENFVNGLMQENLSADQQKYCFQLKNVLTDIERVGDLSENLAMASQERVIGKTEFSSVAIQDLDRLYRHAYDTYSFALQALRTGDHTLAKSVCRMEDEFDNLYIEMRQGHIERIETGVCHPEADIIFTEALRHLERISDHADNLGISTLRS